MTHTAPLALRREAGDWWCATAWRCGTGSMAGVLARGWTAGQQGRPRGRRQGRTIQRHRQQQPAWTDLELPRPCSAAL